MKVNYGLKNDIKAAMLRGQWVLDKEKTKNANYSGLVVGVFGLLAVISVVVVLLGR